MFSILENIMYLYIIIMFLPFIYFGLLCLVNSFFINKPKLNNRSLNMLIKNNLTLTRGSDVEEYDELYLGKYYE